MGTPARFLIRAGNFGHGRSAFALLVARQPHHRLFSQDKLRKIEVEGGTAQTIASVPGGFSAAGTWGTGDNILFAPSNLLNLFMVPGAGGQPIAVTRLEGTELGHFWPQFLPDGKSFLFGSGQQLLLARLNSFDRSEVLRPTGRAVYVKRWWREFPQQIFPCPRMARSPIGPWIVAALNWSPLTAAAPA